MFLPNALRPQADYFANPLKWLVNNNFLPDYFLGIPERMKAIAPLATTSAQNSGYILAGGTDLLLQDFEGANDAPVVNLVYGAKEFNQIRIDNGRVTIGASVTITEVKDSDELNQLLPGLGNYLNLMASTPIRNMATVGGNIANGSPIGDVSVMLMGLDATLVLSNKGIKREVKLRDFFVGYKKVAKDAEELVECVYFDKPNESTRFSFEKISKRIHLDMATVNSSMRVVLEEGVIQKASFAVGGLGPTIRYLDKTADYLVGKGIPADKVSTQGRGEAEPVTGTQCDAIKARAALIDCLAPDRRVEIRVTGVSNPAEPAPAEQPAQ